MARKNEGKAPYVIKVQRQLKKRSEEEEGGDVIPIRGASDAFKAVNYVLKNYGLPTLFVILMAIGFYVWQHDNRADRYADRKEFVGALREGHGEIRRTLEHQSEVLERMLEKLGGEVPPRRNLESKKASK